MRPSTFLALHSKLSDPKRPPPSYAPLNQHADHFWKIGSAGAEGSSLPWWESESANEDQKKRILLGSSCKTRSLQIGHLGDVNKPDARMGNEMEIEIEIKDEFHERRTSFQTLSPDVTGTLTILSCILCPMLPGGTKRPIVMILHKPMVVFCTATALR